MVVGEGRTVSFEMLEAALGMILQGAKLVATNLDPNCPTVDGVRPGCGATVAMLETASGLKAFSVGKPSPVMLRAARKELALPTDQTVVIGDTMDTDILGGVQLNYKTILVLSGSTQPAMTWHATPTGPTRSSSRSPILTRRNSSASSTRRSLRLLDDRHPSHRPRRKPAVAGAF